MPGRLSKNSVAIVIQTLKKTSTEHKTIHRTLLLILMKERCRESFERNKNTRAALFGLSAVNRGFAYSLLSYVETTITRKTNTHEMHEPSRRGFIKALHQCRSSGCGSETAGTYCGYVNTFQNNQYCQVRLGVPGKKRTWQGTRCSILCTVMKSHPNALMPAITNK